MAVDLIYKHQQKTYELMKDGLAQGKKVAYSFPVGCGKSFPPLKYVEENKGKSVLIVVPSIAIKNQFTRYIRKYVEDGSKRLKDKEIQIVTYQKLSLTQRLEKGLKPDIILFDEIHRMGAETWEPAVDSLMGTFPDADVIGMSATPERTDKRNMAYTKFDEVVYEMSLTEALSGEKEDEVVLKTPRYIRVLSQLKEEIEDYKRQIVSIEDEGRRETLLKKYERLEEKVSNFPDIQDVMQQGIKKENGKYIVFCKDREDMFEKMANASQIFGKVNTQISMDYVLSKTETSNQGGRTSAENRRAIEGFVQKKNGEELNLLFCVDMLNEGVHLEGIDGEVMFRPTGSTILYKQQMGRTLSADKEAGETVIIDAVNNWLRQIETFREMEGAIRQGQRDDNSTYSLLDLTPEETDLLSILLEIREDLRYNTNVYEEIIEWLETHDGKMPIGHIRKNGKTLNREKMTTEEQEGVNLRARWFHSEERKVLEEYRGRPIEEVPEEYREKIEVLRSYGLGLEKRTTYEEVIEWLETHEGKLPSREKKRNGRVLKREEMTIEERDELNLRARWFHSEERKVLEEYKEKPIEEVPEEYREKIEILRSYGLGLTIYEEIVKWLKTHGGDLPRGQIIRQGRQLRKEEMTEEEQKETKLRSRWDRCDEKQILKQYTGKPIEEVPEEYRERIKVLRSYNLRINGTAYEEIIEWLETHEGELPRGHIVKQGKQLKKEEMTEEEQKETRLRGKWEDATEERKVLEEYKGRPIEEVPEEYREKIEVLRSYGLGLEERTTYEEIIEWLETHKGKMPRNAISRKHISLKVEEMTEKEKNEVNLRAKWNRTKERQLLKEYEGRPIEEVPEEYREKIARLRELMQKGKDGQIIRVMKTAVGQQVGSNTETREELNGEIQRDESNKKIGDE